MIKRWFRASPPRTESPTYPTLESFERRDFLARLGGALLGAGALATLAGCGDRAVAPDISTLAGDPMPPDAAVDALSPDEQVPEPPESGVAPQPPSKKDAGPEWGVDGDPAQPDAQIDDASFWSGGKPGPDLDGGR